eukprot:g16290.t1
MSPSLSAMGPLTRPTMTTTRLAAAWGRGSRAGPVAAGGHWCWASAAWHCSRCSRLRPGCSQGRRMERACRRIRCSCKRPQDVPLCAGSLYNALPQL